MRRILLILLSALAILPSCATGPTESSDAVPPTVVMEALYKVPGVQGPPPAATDPNEPGYLQTLTYIDRMEVARLEYLGLLDDVAVDSETPIIDWTWQDVPEIGPVQRITWLTHHPDGASLRAFWVEMTDPWNIGARWTGPAFEPGYPDSIIGLLDPALGDGEVFWDSTYLHWQAPEPPWFKVGVDTLTILVKKTLAGGMLRVDRRNSLYGLFLAEWDTLGHGTWMTPTTEGSW